MSGSEESNEELVSGRVNRSNNQTTIWAENTIPYHDLVVHFTGPFIFAVEVAKDSEDDRDGFQPAEPLDAIVGFGWSGEPGKRGGTGVTGIGGTLGGAGVVGKGGENGTGVFADAGGDATGVVGLGGPREGTGVFGLGSGGERVLRRGSGGTGVHGVGGHARLQPGPGDVLPGVGVFGQGGKILEENRDRLPLGTGVIGVGGDANNKDMPAINEAGSVGVFGQGADAKINTIVDGGTGVSDGPAEPGAGVVGRGGIVTGARIPSGCRRHRLGRWSNKTGYLHDGQCGCGWIWPDGCSRYWCRGWCRRAGGSWRERLLRHRPRRRVRLERCCPSSAGPQES